MKKSTAIQGAAFLMATSAIGPGFLTQTSLFTQQLLTSFGFVILLSILLDIAVQANIWRMVTMSEQRAQDLANAVMPGLGIFLAALIAVGGLVFNIGNMAGCGLGMEVMTGVHAKTGAVISCLVALGIFWYREAGQLMDLVARILGLIMIALTIYIVFASHPPLAAALYRTVWPEKTDMMKIITLVGGTVGGYISFAGAHRLMDAGIVGKQHLSQVNRSAVTGILITALMRYLLFLAALGVVAGGVSLAAGNPAAAVFKSAAGNLGYLFFGVVIWSAGITSVVGASFTSFSFWKTLLPGVQQKEKLMISAFILVSTLVFVIVGQPVQLLVWAGAVNGFILPIALGILLIAIHKPSIREKYKHPLWLQVIGWLVAGVLGYMSVVTLRQLF